MMSPEKQANKFHIAIVGNVGTGKSTLAKLICKRIDCTIYLENPKDYPFLRLFWMAPKDWGFANQLNFMMTKFAQQGLICHHNQLAVQEMDAIATHSIWHPASHEIGHISQAEMAEIDCVYNLLATKLISRPDLYIVLQASVETVIGRIRKRGRDFENLDPQFIKLIGLLDKYLAQFTQEAPGNLMIVDTETVDFTKSSETSHALLDDILKHLP